MWFGMVVLCVYIEDGEELSRVGKCGFWWCIYGVLVLERVFISLHVDLCCLQCGCV